MKFYSATIVLSLSCLVVGCASTEGDAGSGRVSTIPRVATEGLDGRDLYRAFCVNCHGPRGRGTALGKKLIDEQANALTDEEIIVMITDGRKDEGMMRFGGNLTAPEIALAAGYVRELQGRNAQRLARLAKSSQATPVTALADSGALATGEALFRGRGACAQCHSVGSEGGTLGPKLDGVASRLSADGLRAALEDPSATIVEGYRIKKAVTKDGRTAEGRVRNETDVTLQILSPSGQTWVTYIKARLESLEESSNSNMPALVFTRLPKAEQESLLAYLATLK